MKIVLLIFALLGLGYAAHLPSFETEVRVSRDLAADLQDFLDLIDEQRIVLIVFSYLEDPQVQAALFYMFSPEFATLFTALLSETAVLEFLAWLEDNGLPVSHWIRVVSDFLGIPSPLFSQVIYERGNKDPSTNPGIAGLLDSIIAALPVDEIRELARYKLENSESFYQAYQTLSSERTQELVRKLRENEVYQYIVRNLAEFGVNVVRIGEIISLIFGWNI